MAVITISRQMGSLGCEVANIVADMLGYRLVWRDLINQAAKIAGAPEMALAAIDELGLFDFSPSPKICLAYRQAVKQVMEDLAQQGNVIIIGRAGQTVLSEWPDSLHVRLIAPLDLRAERIAQRQKITLECARAQVHASDQYRARYLRRCYGIRWENPELYHLVINTGRVTSQQTATIIYQAVINHSTQPLTNMDRPS
jgi:cytidylate kinase